MERYEEAQLEVGYVHTYHACFETLRGYKDIREVLAHGQRCSGVCIVRVNTLSCGHNSLRIVLRFGLCVCAFDGSLLWVRIAYACPTIASLCNKRCMPFLICGMPFSACDTALCYSCSLHALIRVAQLAVWEGLI